MFVLTHFQVFHNWQVSNSVITNICYTLLNILNSACMERCRGRGPVWSSQWQNNRDFIHLPQLDLTRKYVHEILSKTILEFCERQTNIISPQFLKKLTNFSLKCLQKSNNSTGSPSCCCVVGRHVFVYS